jgi:hypothetical protein
MIHPRSFRWADLQIKRLEESNTRDEVIEALQTIPNDLASTYRDVLDKFPPKTAIARSILIWLSFAIEPMTIEAVADAVSLQFPERVLKICTTSLITIGVSDKLLRLAHFSVKEFLLLSNTTGNSFWAQFSADFAHLLLAENTIDCIIIQAEQITEDRFSEESFYAYSLSH